MRVILWESHRDQIYFQFYYLRFLAEVNCYVRTFVIKYICKYVWKSYLTRAEIQGGSYPQYHSAQTIAHKKEGL